VTVFEACSAVLYIPRQASPNPLSSLQVIRPSGSFQAIQRNYHLDSVPIAYSVHLAGCPRSMEHRIPIDTFHFFPLYQHMALWATAIPAPFLKLGTPRLERGFEGARREPGKCRGQPLRTDTRTCSTKHCDHTDDILTSNSTIKQTQSGRDILQHHFRYTPHKRNERKDKKIIPHLSPTHNRIMYTENDHWWSSNLGNCPKE